MIVVLISAVTKSEAGQSADQAKKIFEKMEWRNIGPAEMGGRTVDIDVVESSPWIIYAAIGPSGVWKSVTNGFTWEPVFEKESTVSVGDIAIDQSRPDTVWVGTGEATSRNSTTIGDGVYRSTDGGKSWVHRGLKDTRHISRIVIDPVNPDTVYVAAMGHLWGPNEERGIYKTEDGGETWDNILYVNETTGCADLVMDPSDSLILYAASYDHRRYPYYFRSGGPGSAVYKTVDGGRNWKKLTKDLPEGTLGRIGLDVSRSSPNVVYALIEHEDGGIWRSEDKGESWARTCDNETYVMVNNRPFYYSQIRIDPSNDETVYVFSGGNFVSHDRGQKFRSVSGGTHPDHHALWIDPKNPLHLIDGNDGGIDISYDGGRSWWGARNMILSEVYQIGYDMRDPYYVYCGLQDNGLWGGPSATYDAKGITNEDWYAVGGGDGFYAQVDPEDHTVVYGNSQMNGLYRFDLKTGLSKTIRPLALLKDKPYRYNWNAPILISPHDAKTVYTAGNVLFRTRNGGVTWETISPDLTTDDPDKQKDSGGPITPDNTGAEVHCTIITITESPVEAGVIWCGTDDGNVQVTRDGGKTWANTVGNIMGLPPNTWCSRIEASHFKAGTAYAAFDGHRTDDYGTYVYKTSDFGKTWTSVRGDLPFGWVHVIREDLKNPNLLFVGMEFGVFASLDGGRSWFSPGKPLPTLAVRDIAVHPSGDLIIGTHGRGVWIMDDILPLQEMTPEVMAKDVYFFPIRPATRYFPSSRYEVFSADEFSVSNPPYGMGLSFYFSEKPADIPKVFISDKAGERIFEIHLKKREGLQRAVWGLQFTPKTPDGQVVTSSLGLVSAPFVPEGEYTVELQVGDQVSTQKGQVKPDPRRNVEDKHLRRQAEMVVGVMAVQRRMGLAVTAVKQLRRSLDGQVKPDLDKQKNVPEHVRAALAEFERKFTELEDSINPKGIGYRGSLENALRGGDASTQLLMLGMSLSGFPFEATETDKRQLKELTMAVGGHVERLNAFLDGDLTEINEAFKEAGLKTLRIPKKID